MAEGETMSKLEACSECGSKNIFFRAMAWVNPATYKVAEFEIMDNMNVWCNDCQGEVELEEFPDVLPCDDCGEALYYDNDDEMYYHVKQGHECFLHGFKDESATGAAGQTMAGWFVRSKDQQLLTAAAADFIEKVRTQTGVTPVSESLNKEVVHIDLEFMLSDAKLALTEFDWLESWSQQWNIELE